MTKLSAAVVCLVVYFGGGVGNVFAQGGAVVTVPAGGDLQGAIDRAVPGDTIQLEPGATYKGCFVLREKAGSAFVTIRTAPDPRQPMDGIRVTPAHAPALARIVSGSSLPAIRTAG